VLTIEAQTLRFFLAMASRKTAYKRRQPRVMVKTTAGKRIGYHSATFGHLLELTKIIPLIKNTTYKNRINLKGVKQN